MRTRVRTMQLRVARLCLDCEELHVDDACPICASSRYAFLSIWLPSQERRRWRRPAPSLSEPNLTGAMWQHIARWLGFPAPLDRPTRLRTRASDFVPKLDFDEPVK